MNYRYSYTVCKLLYTLLFGLSASAQTISDSANYPGENLSKKYFSNIVSKSEKYSEQFTKQTDKYLSRLQKQEDILKSKLQKVDSIAANNIFTQSAAKYKEIQEKVKSKTGKLLNGDGRYFPWLDTVTTSLKFLESSNPQLAKIAGVGAQLKETMGKLKEMERQLKEAENIREFVRQRKQFLNEQFNKYGLGNELKKFNKEAWYYGQQLTELKQAWEDPAKFERKMIILLNKIPLFQKFFQQYGELAGLFTIPPDYAQNMNGLQTIGIVQTQMQQRIAGMGPNAQQVVQQNIQSAQADLSTLRTRMAQYGERGDGDMPDFKPSTVRTKTFWNRLEYGTNVQTQKSTNFFPVATDIGLSIGYRISDNSVAGIGSSFKMGWGQNIRNIKISAEGLSLRSYIDVKLKGSFFVSGGYEQNYRARFYNVQQLRNQPNNWSNSGLVGISKVVSLKTKLFKKTKVQLLWDFLRYRNRQTEQPIKFRVGYNF
jgi:hypothetical protein